MSTTNPYALPYLEEIFGKLRRGEHICAEDGDYYYALRKDFDLFSDLFTQLGFRLECHPRDFFYFRGKSPLSETSSRLALFIFILMEYLEGKGEPVVETLLTKSFAMDELPHLTTDRYRSYMKEAGVEDDEALEGLISNLSRLGIAQRKGNTFRFRAPIYRFFDICLRILKPDEADKAAEETV